MRVGAPQPQRLFEQVEPAIVLGQPIYLAQAHADNIGIAAAAGCPEQLCGQRWIVVQGHCRCRGLALQSGRSVIEHPAVAKEQALHLFIGIVVRRADRIAAGVDARIGIGAALEQQLGTGVLGIAGSLGQGLAPGIGFALVLP